VGKDDYTESELSNIKQLRNTLSSASESGREGIEGFALDEGEEFKVYAAQLKQITETNAQEIAKTFKDYEKATEEKRRVYEFYTNEEDNSDLATFHSDLLLHLAGTIVVKEHRQRYQKEQFDRFVSSIQYKTLAKPNKSLEQFCRDYALLIEALVEESHQGRSPKIEANYDDYGERTSRPLNATIFYYFFSADRRKRTVAAWLLSTIRYPNEKLRRAYLRFFA
jgi:hypothetical protein